MNSEPDIPQDGERALQGNAAQEWERTVSWTEGGGERSAALHFRRKIKGKKDHLIAFVVDPETGQRHRLAKYETATGKVSPKPSKVLMDSWTTGLPPIGLFEQARSFCDEIRRSISET